MPDFGHLVELIIAAITFWGIAWGFHRQDRKEQRKSQELVQIEQDRRHLENIKKIDGLTTALKYGRPHVHTEKAGPLTREGVWYLPNGDTQ